MIANVSPEPAEFLTLSRSLRSRPLMPVQNPDNARIFFPQIKTHNQRVGRSRRRSSRDGGGRRRARTPSARLAQSFVDPGPQAGEKTLGAEHSARRLAGLRGGCVSNRL